MTLRSQQLEIELDDISRMVRDQLLECWNTLMDTEPPSNISSKLMRRAVAYQLQAKALGGLKPASQKQLRKVARGVGSICPINTKPKTIIKLGSRLIRELNGKTYMVEVTKDGFVWQEQQYNSLSAIARAITGARWSGPRFFGL